MFSVGDIIHFHNSIAGKAKFHFCFVANVVDDRFSFIFLNSDGIFEDHFVVDDSRLPGMPKSKTGKTVFSCPTLLVKTGSQLTGLNARLVCRLPADVAAEFLVFARDIQSMTAGNKAALIAALEALR